MTSLPVSMLGRSDAAASLADSAPVSARPPAPVPSPSPADGAIDLAVVEDLASLEAEWRAFEREAEMTPFQSFDWLSRWQTHIGAQTGVRPAIVTGRTAGGGLVLLLPFALRGPAFARRLTWLGAPLSDYSAPLLGPGFPRLPEAQNLPRFWGRVFRLVAREAGRFALIDLGAMPAEVGRQPNPMLALPCRAHPSNAYATDLGDDWERFYQARRSASSRKHERKEWRRLADQGPLRFVVVEETGEAIATIDELAAQKGRAFERMGVRNRMLLPGMIDFYHALSADLASSGFVRLSRLDVGGEVAAASLGLFFRGCFYLILSSYFDGPLSKHGPGRAHLRETLHHAFAIGARRFDFTVGDEPYKRDWTERPTPLFDYVGAADPVGL